MEINQLYNQMAIPILAFVVIALILLIVAIAKKSVILAIVGISIIIVLFFYTLMFNPSMANAISVFSTIGLVIFAGVALYLNFQSMKYTKDKEERDRKVKLLDEIIEWATEVPSFGLKNYSNFALIIHNPSALTRAYNKSNLLGFKALDIKGEYIESISNIFGDEIQDAVKELRNELKQYIAYLDRNGDKTDLDADLHKRDTINEITKKILSAAISHQRIPDETKP